MNTQLVIAALIAILTAIRDAIGSNRDDARQIQFHRNAVAEAERLLGELKPEDAGQLRPLLAETLLRASAAKVPSDENVESTRRGLTQLDRGGTAAREDIRQQRTQELRASQEEQAQRDREARERGNTENQREDGRRERDENIKPAPPLVTGDGAAQEGQPGTQSNG